MELRELLYPQLRAGRRGSFVFLVVHASVRASIMLSSGSETQEFAKNSHCFNDNLVHFP